MKRCRRILQPNSATPRLRITKQMVPVDKQNAQLITLYNSLAVRFQSLQRLKEQTPKDQTELNNSIDALLESNIYQTTKHAIEQINLLKDKIADCSNSPEIKQIMSQALSIFIFLAHLHSHLAVAILTPIESLKNICGDTNSNYCNGISSNLSDLGAYCVSANMNNSAIVVNNNNKFIKNHFKVPSNSPFGLNISAENGAESKRTTLPNLYTGLSNQKVQPQHQRKFSQNQQVQLQQLQQFHSPKKPPRLSFDDSEDETYVSNVGDTLICRICEKVVPVDLIESHTTLCIQAHQMKYQFLSSSEKLKRLNHKISHLYLKVKFPGPIQDATTYIYQLLYLYLTIDIAIRVKATDTDGTERLESIISALDSFSAPQSMSNYVTYFVKARYLVEQKLASLRDMFKASKAVAATTIDHSVGGCQATISDFSFIERLSAGAFARVYLAKKKSTGDLYAIKVIKKSHANLKNQMHRVSVERDIMMQLHSPHMVNFYYSFVKNNNIYLVMEYIPGGDIFSLLQNVGSLEETHAKNYAAQVVKALQFLRENSIIHRDLKPDNILIDSNGMLRLTDFGLSFFGLNGRQQSARVGTPDYMAPEIILSLPHSYSCDYWSLGVMIYELIEGVPPFHGHTEDETFQKILTTNFDVSTLTEASDEVKDLIKRLLVANPETRLGAKNMDEILRHPWFGGIDWDNLRSMEPVFVPDMSEGPKTYFISRYEFPDDAESDIREDLSTNENTYEDYCTTSCDSARGENRKSFKDYNFPKVSLQHLKITNEGVAKKIRSKHWNSDAESCESPPPVEGSTTKMKLSRSQADQLCLEGDRNMFADSLLTQEQSPSLSKAGIRHANQSVPSLLVQKPFIL